MATVRVASTHSTCAPRRSATKRSGTIVRPSTACGATSSLTDGPLTQAVVLPNSKIMACRPLYPATVFVASSQVTLAPSDSKMARKGTRVRPLRIIGATSVVRGRPLSVMRMGLTCADTAPSSARGNKRATSAKMMMIFRKAFPPHKLLPIHIGNSIIACPQQKVVKNTLTKR